MRQWSVTLGREDSSYENESPETTSIRQGQGILNYEGAVLEHHAKEWTKPDQILYSYINVTFLDEGMMIMKNVCYVSY